MKIKQIDEAGFRKIRTALVKDIQAAHDDYELHERLTDALVTREAIANQCEYSGQ